MATSLMERIKKASTIKETRILAESEFFTDVDETPTDIFAINVALSGSITGGLKSGLLTLAGESKNFKTMYGLLMASAYLKKNKEAVLIFYDSEFGSPTAYFESVGIDTNRVLHVPVKNLEELKFDLMQQLTEIKKGDKLFVMVDSIGNLASKKEAEDAEDGKSVQDMTRAKFLKGFYRIITPYLRIKDIPMVQIAHTYETQEMFSKTIVSGGKGITLASDAVWIIGKSQEKDGTDLAGFNFTIRINKSRYVREKSAIPITVKFEGGVSRYTGLLDMAVDSGVVVKPSNGWYSRVDDDGVIESKKFRIKETDNKEFWVPVLANKKFLNWIEENYQVSQGALISDEEIDSAIQDEDE